MATVIKLNKNIGIEIIFIPVVVYDDFHANKKVDLNLFY